MPKHLILLIKSNTIEFAICLAPFDSKESLTALRGSSISLLSFNNFFSSKGLFKLRCPSIDRWVNLTLSLMGLKKTL